MLAGRALLALVAVSFMWQPTQPEAGWSFSTAFIITVDEQGGAKWVVERRMLLQDDEAVRAFDEYAAELEKNLSSHLREFEEKMTSIVERAVIVTGRSMEAADFNIVVGKVQAATGLYGVIRYEFYWRGFARVEDSKVVVGDVFEGGFYLSRDDVLIIKLPPHSTVVAATPPQDQVRGGELIWYGRRDFGAGEPRVVVELAGAPASTERRLEGMLPYVLAAVAALATSAALALTRMRRKLPASPALAAHQLVIQLLKKHGGALPQSKIVELTGFSKAKVSMVVSELERRGLVYRRRVGRQNIVYLR